MIRLRNGQIADVARMDEADAAQTLDFLNIVAGETDYLTFGPGEFGPTLKEQQAYLGSFHDGEAGLILKAVVADQIVGVVSIRRIARPRIRHVGELGISVLRSHWGTGLGKALCQSALAAAPKIGVTKIELRVRQDNARAIKLYEALGFVMEGAPRAAFRVGEKYYDEYSMGIVLSEVDAKSKD